MINAVYGGSMKTIRSSYNRDYFLALWPGYLLVLAGYALGSVGSYYLVAAWGWATDLDATIQIASFSSYMWVGGLMGAFVAMLFFIPYYFQVMGLLVDKYKQAFAAFSLTLANLALSELKEAQRLTSEQAQEVQKSLDEAKKKAEEDKDKDDDKDEGPKDDDHKGGSGNHPDLSDYGTSDHSE
jgi:FtsZ-binding cell division protein ZapB